MGGDGGGGVGGKPKMGNTIHGHRESIETATVYVSGQDDRWQQLDTTCSLFSVPQ